MSERKRCVKCARPIDDWAKICPYCNWEQSRPVPAASVAPPPAAASYTPPEEKQLLKKRLGFALAGVLVLLTSFAVGMVINKDDAVKNAPEPILDQAAKEKYGAVKRADTPLVPAGEGGFEQPFTSAPATLPTSTDGTPSQYDRSDATAVSAAEYAELAKRAQAERQRTAPLVDPRSLSGAAYAQGQRVPLRRQPMRTASDEAQSGQRVARTRPVPQHQPVPQLRASGTAKLDLMIGPDGRVQSIHIRRALRGSTPAVIAAVQRWRFKPATENGRPVSAPYSVEISYGNR